MDLASRTQRSFITCPQHLPIDLSVMTVASLH